MYGRILVPLDGSPLSERAVQVAVPIAERHGARLVLLHVEPMTYASLGIPGAMIQDPAFDAGGVIDERPSVERIAKRVRRRSSIPVEVVYRTGRPVQQIAAYCAQAEIHLVVMCTHGRGGFSRFWLGGVADGLLRQLTVPTLLIRGRRGGVPVTPAGMEFPRILVPLDGSPHAEGAVDAAMALLGEAPATLTLLRVIHPMTTVGDTAFPTRAERECCAQYLEPLAARHRREGLNLEVETAVTADVAKGILVHAERHNVSLIALATQGLGGVQRFVVGSVADKLIRTAPMPVLVVP